MFYLMYFDCIIKSSRQSTTALELVDQSLQKMMEKNLIVVDSDGKLKVTKLGRATLKGIVDLDRSTQLYNDLRIAQGGLVLMTKLHLMYLVTPYDMVGTVTPIATTYFQVTCYKGSFVISFGKYVICILIRLLTNCHPKRLVWHEQLALTKLSWSNLCRTSSRK